MSKATKSCDNFDMNLKTVPGGRERENIDGTACGNCAETCGRGPAKASCQKKQRISIESQSNVENVQREIEKEAKEVGDEKGTTYKSIVYPSQSAAGHRFCLN